jgi:hypothetical protein
MRVAVGYRGKVVIALLCPGPGGRDRGWGSAVDWSAPYQLTMHSGKLSVIVHLYGG